MKKYFKLGNCLRCFPDFHLLTSSDDCVRKKPVVCALIFVVRGLIAIVRSSPLNWDIVGYYQLLEYVFAFECQGYKQGKIIECDFKKL